MKTLKNWKRDFNQMNYLQYIQFFNKIDKYRFDKIKLLKSFLTNNKIGHYDKVNLLKTAQKLFNNKYFFEKLLMEDAVLFIDLRLLELLKHEWLGENTEKINSIKLNVRFHTIKLQNDFIAEHPEIDFSHLQKFKSSDKHNPYKGVWVNKI